MRLHFFNSAVIANSKMDYFGKECSVMYNIYKDLNLKYF